MSREDLIDRVYNNDFDYEEFFDGSSCRAALEVITPFQDIKVTSDEHETAAQIIYEALYGSIEDGYYGNWKKFENCILIKFVNNYIIITFPDFINKYQYDRITDLFNYLGTFNINFEIIVSFSEDNLSFEDILIYLNDIISYDALELNFEKILR